MAATGVSSTSSPSVATSPPVAASAKRTSSRSDTTSSRRNSASSNYDEEVLDPRVKVELEKLNHATDAINRLELELDEARGAFRQMLSESAVRLNGLSKKLGSCIEKARPYYEARMHCKEAQMETQKAAIRFERANSMHVAAKEMVALAEQGLARQGRGGFDPAWQEMLNHSTMKVNEAEQERIASETYHKLASHRYQEADQYVKYLQKDLKRNIAKSRSYFETKAKFNQLMEEQKTRVTKLEEQVLQTKKLYAESLRNLEQISDEIHQQREEQRIMRSLGSRESGVGAETPDPPHKVETPSPEHHVNRPAIVKPPPFAATSPATTTSSDKSAFGAANNLPPRNPEISLEPPESSGDDEDVEGEDPELSAVNFNDIRDSLKEIKEGLSTCTTPERGVSPVLRETDGDVVEGGSKRLGDNRIVDDDDNDLFKRPPHRPFRSSSSTSMPTSPKGLVSRGSEGNLSSNLQPHVGGAGAGGVNSSSGFSSASRSSSFQTRLGIAGGPRPFTALSNASSADDLDSETESLASVEMLGDQQIEMLMIDEEIAAMKKENLESNSGVEDDGISTSTGTVARESELDQVLRSISLKHSVSLDKLKHIALNIKETSRKPVNLNDLIANNESP